MDAFCIKESDFSESSSKSYEGMMAQGNGYLSFRASMEEGLAGAPQNEEYIRSMTSVTTEIQRNPVSKWGVYIPLIMGKNPYLNDVIINLPYLLYIGMKINGNAVDMLQIPVTDYSRELNMRNGVLTRRFAVDTGAGGRAVCTVERFASMERKHIVVQKVVWRAEGGPAEIELEPGIDADVTTNGYRHYQEPEISSGPVSTMAVRTDQDFLVTMGFTVESAVCLEDAHDFWKMVKRCRIRLEAGQEIVLIKKNAVVTNRDMESGDGPGRVVALLEAAGTLSYEALLEENALAWKKKWESCDVNIKGDDRLQWALRFSVYHLIRSSMESDSRVQICAKGYAGEAYYGRYFWDSEIYMLPFFIYTNPEAAKKMILYRYHTLEGAKRNAKRYHCKGARYPWQSGLDGTEQCSLWEYADNEIHITADVAYGVMHYYRATGDDDFMKQAGLEILLETARFWICRVDWDECGNSHLLNVMGPDEYSPMTRDNAFTNRMVKKNLCDAAAMYKYWEEKDLQWLETLKRRIQFCDEELEGFLFTAEKLVIPYDAERKLYLQSADFEDYADIDIGELWKDRNRPFGFFASQEKIYRSRCIKQADVLALMALLPGEFTDLEVERAFDYYAPYTTHDSSLSPAVHLLIANRLGRREETERFLRQAIEVDLAPERKGTEEGIHIANCGCLWQAVVMEFAGLKSAVEMDELTISPKLPEGIEEISFQVCWHNRRYRITISKEGVKADEVQSSSF